MPAGPAQVKVWDPLVRIGHWALAVCVGLAWATRHGGGRWHEAFGYGAIAIVAVRVLWGFSGSPNARFAQFVRPPRQTLDYARQLLVAGESRHLGHNPLGAWMIVALLLVVFLTSLTGWLYTTDRYWGVKWVADLHEALSTTLLCLIALHLAGVALASWRHRENLVAAMLHGRKRVE